MFSPEVLFQYWYMFFAGLIIATFANLIGAGGSKFFSPLYMYHIGFSPIVAIVSALFTQSFGFGSGSLSYIKQNQVDFPIAFQYLWIAIPLSVLGAIISHFIPVDSIEFIFGIVLILNSIAILYYDKIIKRLDTNPFWGEFTEKLILISGSLFLGLISVGLGELITPTFLLKYRFPTQKAVGTSVFIVFISTVCSAFTHIIFMQVQGVTFFEKTTLSVLIWMILGAMMGAQLGSKISARVSTGSLKKVLTVAFIFLGSFILISKWIRL